MEGLELLEYHNNDKLRSKANDLLDNYFYKDDEDEEEEEEEVSVSHGVTSLVFEGKKRY